MVKKRRSRAFKEIDQVIDFEEERQKRKERRKQLTSKKSKIQKAQPALVSERRTSKKVKRRLVYIGIMMVVLCIVGFSAYNVISLRAERAEAQAANDALVKERNKLQKELSLVDSDEYIEEVARDDLHMIKNGEKIYVLPNENSSGAAVEDTTDSGILLASEPPPEDGLPEPGMWDKLKGFGADAVENAKDVIEVISTNLKSLLRK